MSTNLRRVKRDETGQDMSKVVWEQTMRAVEDAAVDIWAAQDTGVEDVVHLDKQHCGVLAG